MQNKLIRYLSQRQGVGSRLQVPLSTHNCKRKKIRKQSYELLKMIYLSTLKKLD